MPKRRHPRVATQRRVEYRCAKGHGEGVLMDLSLDGCRIQGTLAVSVGARIRLQLWLPDQSDPVKIDRAVVRWVKTNQCGVSFLEVPSAAGTRIRQVFRLLHEAQQPEGK